VTLDPNICSHVVTPRDHHNGASLPGSGAAWQSPEVDGGVDPGAGGDPAATLNLWGGRCGGGMPDAVRLVPRRRLDVYVQLTGGPERQP